MWMEIGDRVAHDFIEEVTSEEDASLGARWQVSEETRREIEAIEANFHVTETVSGRLVLR
jgi:hypothetical protein